MDRSWMSEAKCKGADTSIMFPMNFGAGEIGKRLCAACPVRAKCLAYALEMIADGTPICGLWGGQYAGVLKSRAPQGELTEEVCELVYCDRMVPAIKFARGRPQRFCSPNCRRIAAKERARLKAAAADGV